MGIPMQRRPLKHCFLPQFSQPRKSQPTQILSMTGKSLHATSAFQVHRKNSPPLKTARGWGRTKNSTTCVTARLAPWIESQCRKFVYSFGWRIYTSTWWVGTEQYRT
ncbi:hypothetical protein H6P81_018755 [Aristolochia fimbriata]|uniref:Uncharacterized protein n=1 Tax=Aristolochia fimbriata TaxID=158543 RepID=A0AAV7E4Y5_ARIFI|nr:hypothetical protein H6P81_018755 [Aristolochia fimbriata]